MTPKKHQVSMQVAESKGLPKLKYHLLPRTKGFWVTVQSLRGIGEYSEFPLWLPVRDRLHQYGFLLNRTNISVVRHRVYAKKASYTKTALFFKNSSQSGLKKKKKKQPFLNLVIVKLISFFFLLAKLMSQLKNLILALQPLQP